MEEATTGGVLFEGLAETFHGLRGCLIVDAYVLDCFRQAQSTISDGQVHERVAAPVSPLLGPVAPFAAADLLGSGHEIFPLEPRAQLLKGDLLGSRQLAFGEQGSGVARFSEDNAADHFFPGAGQSALAHRFFCVGDYGVALLGAGPSAAMFGEGSGLEPARIGFSA